MRMRLRRRLALRYGVIVALSLGIVGIVAYHEFVREPRMLAAAHVVEPQDFEWFEIVEIGMFIALPLTFGLGWWLVDRSLDPLHALVREVQSLHAGNLRHRVPQSGNGDEVDQLALAFNGLAARLERTFAHIQSLTIDASHELKTPLTIIRSELEELLAASPEESSADSLHSILEEVDRMTRIVDALTLLTKADAGLVRLRREPVALDSLVRECFEDAQVLGQRLSLAISLPACEPASLTGDRHRLRQVLLNLTDNATKYNHAGGHVRISLHREDGRARLVVANSGPTVPASLQERVFERFVRGENAPSDGEEGSGLGLAICRWIVEAHGGTITLRSGSGETIVTALLPLDEASLRPRS